MVRLDKTGVISARIIVFYDDNNNQWDASFSLRETLHKFLKTLAPKLTPKHAHWL